MVGFRAMMSCILHILLYFMPRSSWDAHLALHASDMFQTILFFMGFENSNTATERDCCDFLLQRDWKYVQVFWQRSLWFSVSNFSIALALSSSLSLSFLERQKPEEINPNERKTVCLSRSWNLSSVFVVLYWLIWSDNVALIKSGFDHGWSSHM